jgi:predicted transcriptional regulator
MKLHKWGDIRRSAKDPARSRRVQQQALAEVLDITLAELRQLVGVTQAELAEAAEMSQGEVSAFERRTDFKFSTLLRYVRALHGKVEIVVGEKRFTLQGA